MDNETKKMFELILNKLDNMDTRLNTMESRQDEIYQVVKAIEHANQVHRAEIDNVKIRTEGVEIVISN